MKRIPALIGLVCLASACATVDINKPPIPVTPANSAGAVGIDVYAKDRLAGNPVPRFRGQDTVTIRTFGSRENQGYGEIADASCTLDAGLYRAAFTTPANLVVPDYGPNSPAIFVQCDDGARTKSVTVNAVNLTAQQRNANAAGTGLLGAIIIGAVNEANRDNETDDFGYNAIKVRMSD